MKHKFTHKELKEELRMQAKMQSFDWDKHERGQGHLFAVAVILSLVAVCATAFFFLA